MQGASKKTEQIYKSGEEVPESGVYTVIHDQHRSPHTATIFRGQHFPPCAHCGLNVRFTLLRAAASIVDDADFQ